MEIYAARCARRSTPSPDGAMPWGMTGSIWTNNCFNQPLAARFAERVAPRRICVSPDAVDNYLSPAAADVRLADCEVAFGQPDPQDLLRSDRIRFVQLTTAGYTRYDRPDLRARFKERGIVVSNASSVYAEPCAQHALAMILGIARQLPEAMISQRETHGWPTGALRTGSSLINRQCTVLLVGYGAIARRLVELLQPFGVSIRAFRRTPRGDENCPTFPISTIDQHLGEADHVVNILPLSDQTRGFFNAGRLARLKSNARFYNIGRGDTVDQPALIEALEREHLAAAYLDVMTPEPLPADQPLWTTPRCYLTPHTAGGWRNESEAQIEHFVSNLQRFDRGEPVIDRIM